MDDIKNYNPTEAETLDSREVAEMVEKQHKNLLRDINEYIKEMEGLGKLKNELSSKAPRITPLDFFIPSTYISDQGKKLPCYLITKKGCEFVANKLKGEKGTKFTALYVTRFTLMEEREKAAIGGKTTKSGKTPEELAPPTSGPRRCCSTPRTELRVSFKNSTTGRAPNRSIRRWHSAISTPRMGFTSPVWPSRI